MFILTIGVACSGFAISGFNVNHLDIAPRYASILMGLSNGIGTIAGIICSIVVDLILGEAASKTACLTKKMITFKFYFKQMRIEDFTKIFNIGALVHLTGITFYYIFASGEPQPWAEPSDEQQSQWANQMPHAQPTLTPVIQETSFVQYDNPSTEINQGPTTNYGATSNVASNPFLNPGMLAENTIQPPPTDQYMYGGPEERNY